jgi:hypothetical protein
MLELSEVLRQQGYSNSPHFYDLRQDSTLRSAPAQGASLMREAQAAGLQGLYTFRTQPVSGDAVWSRRIAVGLAEALAGPEAQAEAAARDLHRNVWNLGIVPFLVVVLPHQVRLYSGFSYGARQADGLEHGLLDTVHLQRLRTGLAALRAEAIDSGEVWKGPHGQMLDPETRVDRALLRALQALGRQLQEAGSLPPETCHSLIGKYIYLRYLWDRGILDDARLRAWGIEHQDVFGRNASQRALSSLVSALEKRFNGRIFPLSFERGEVEDWHVQRVSSAILGDKGDQLHLPFQPYDFKHIPVEMLSMIYEQFLRWSDEKVPGTEEDGAETEVSSEQETTVQKSGIVYTPVFLADYVLSEAERVRSIEPGMRVLDPACGSGVFLVLAYRRLIEKKQQQLGRDLTPPELSALLTQSIFGVERESSACAVAEFSLLLTLLHYCDPPDLLGREDFQFPSLRGVNVLHANFFDVDSLVCGKVDLVLGNPPWTELSSKKKEVRDEATRRWIESHGGNTGSRVTGRRVAEAFSQRVAEFLEPGDDPGTAGIAALLLPATSLFNAESKNYRQDFFQHKEILRITDFANLREVLFGKKTEHPAASIVYRLRRKHAVPEAIRHVSPFGIDQIGGSRRQPWGLTIHEDEIRSVPYAEAESGDSVVWKLALWGTARDAQALRRLKRIFPTTLADFCHQRPGWIIAEGPQIRSNESRSNRTEETIARPDFLEHRRLDTKTQTRSRLGFSIAEAALVPNTADRLRKQGGERGLRLTSAPHTVISPRWLSYLAYSDRPFLVSPRTIGIAAPAEDADVLRALTVYLCSSLAAYHLFFHATEWGAFRRARYVTLREVKRIPVPTLSPAQIQQLAQLQKKIVAQERTEIEGRPVARRELFHSDAPPLLPEPGEELRERLIGLIDAEIFETFKISRDLAVLIREWKTTRLPLDRAATAGQVTRQPTADELLAYAQEIQRQLDGFVTGNVHHRVRLIHSPTLVECKIEQLRSASCFPVDPSCIEPGNRSIADLLSSLAGDLRQKLSQWVYVQRGLRLFENDTIYLYKPARLIDWTCTQAMIDATDIIGTVVAAKTE